MSTLDPHGMVGAYKVNRPLNDSEKRHRFDVNKPCSQKPHYELSLIKLNSTFVECVDKWYSMRGFVAMGGVALSGLAFGVFGLSCLLFFVDGYLPALALVIFSALLSGAAIHLLTRDAFTYTHYPIRAEVQVRSANLNGGIDAAAENLKKVGKASTFLKRAGYVGVAIDAAAAGINAHAAYKSGDTKAGNVEVGKGVGSIAFGIGGGALAGAAAGSVLLVFGIATGGVGLVLVGAVAAFAGYQAGEQGKKLGEWSATKINEGLF